MQPNDLAHKGRMLPPTANLQVQLMLEQISQRQEHIHRLEEEIEKAPFEASAQRLMAVLTCSYSFRPFAEEKPEKGFGSELDQRTRPPVIG